MDWPTSSALSRCIFIFINLSYQKRFQAKLLADYYINPSIQWNDRVQKASLLTDIHSIAQSAPTDPLNLRIDTGSSLTEWTLYSNLLLIDTKRWWKGFDYEMIIIIIILAVCVSPALSVHSQKEIAEWWLENTALFYLVVAIIITVQD
jgi:hypothetical protein